MDFIDLCERGLVPDVLTRVGVRWIIARRLADEAVADLEQRTERTERFLRELQQSPIAIDTAAANTQHYEVPAEFFRLHLGPRLKYSCCLYETGEESLAVAEQAMLELYVQRAEVRDGQRIFDLGCGWGSLSLYLAERFPGAQVVGLSNSNGQREFIEGRAAERGLKNLRIVTGNITSFEFDGTGLADPDRAAGFDRVLSIEMFEHMKNYGLLLAKLARWLKPDGKLFVHLFAHRTLAYHYETRDRSDWMSRYFFTGGTMPSQSLLLRFQEDLCITRQWWLSGMHYKRTAAHWLAGLDRHRDAILALFHKAYGRDAEVWVQRWRMFYLAVEELFGYRAGSEWGVAHFLFEPRPRAQPSSP
jgi:cyclopropane-fatty-acyl-phospholipid synthase